MTPLRTKSLLRRVASDDSILYHTLSPTTSLDDGKFNDVHEMVNLRFMAIKESLPSLPNFNVAWRSSLNLSSYADAFAVKDPLSDTAKQAPQPSAPAR